MSLVQRSLAAATYYIVPSYAHKSRKNVTIGQALFSVALLATSLVALKRDCAWSKTCKAVAGVSGLYFLGLICRVGFQLRGSAKPTGQPTGGQSTT